MKKILLITGLTTLLLSGCAKSKNENPQPDLSEWADLGNTIFNDDPFDTIPVKPKKKFISVPVKEDSLQTRNTTK